ncbi:hypothetical protein EV126DRAFT_50048 [Verticillium dahliae]|nr:hypothetical protein EV126DRAFT_50048 [Verticillium dahliae]
MAERMCTCMSVRLFKSTLVLAWFGLPMAGCACTLYLSSYIVAPRVPWGCLLVRSAFTTVQKFPCLACGDRPCMSARELVGAPVGRIG